MENTNTTQTEKKESLDLIDYRLTAIESTLAEMKNLLLTTKLQNQRLDTLEETQKKIETKEITDIYQPLQHWINEQEENFGIME